MIRLFGSRAVFSLVSLAFMPPIRAQNDFLRPLSSSVLGFGAGGFKFIPCAFAEARPLAFRPPFGSLPAERCHAGDLAIDHLPLAARMLSTRFGYGLPAAFAAALALDFFADDNALGFGKPFGRDLSHTGFLLDEDIAPQIKIPPAFPPAGDFRTALGRFAYCLTKAGRPQARSIIWRSYQRAVGNLSNIRSIRSVNERVVSCTRS